MRPDWWTLYGDPALDALVAQAAAADQEAVDLYAFTSVLKRELDMEARVEFVRLMWEIVYADGEAVVASHRGITIS